jgi:hypothetical protein
MTMHRALLGYLVLPANLSEFEAGYLQRTNKIALLFFLLHLPVFVAVAYFNDTGPALAAGLTTLVLAGPVAAYQGFSTPRVVSLVYGFVAMLMGGLLVHFGQGPMQIEMHFYFFALLAMLTIFGNPLVIVDQSRCFRAVGTRGWPGSSAGRVRDAEWDRQRRQHAGARHALRVQLPGERDAQRRRVVDGELRTSVEAIGGSPTCGRETPDPPDCGGRSRTAALSARPSGSGGCARENVA